VVLFLCYRKSFYLFTDPQKCKTKAKKLVLSSVNAA
jgi:hypothetical protein